MGAGPPGIFWAGLVLNVGVTMSHTSSAGMNGLGVRSAIIADWM